jgi:hypothetical protein
MKYGLEMGSGGMICLPSFMNIGRGIPAILRFALAIKKAVMLVLLGGRDLQNTP